MSTFVFRLMASRPTFALDMTDTENNRHRGGRARTRVSNLAEKGKTTSTSRPRLLGRCSVLVLFAIGASLLLNACSSSTGSGSSATESTSQTLRIMVTNDDGVGAPGINAVVQGLRTLPHTSVTVVAPLTNQSGTGGQTTPSSSGALVTSAAQTQSGYPATAVHGYPADTVIWAVKEHGLSFKPDLVVSGINFGQNLGPSAAQSGTVGAAREAVSLGVPALAASQGLDNGQQPAFSEGVPLVEAWVTSHRRQLLASGHSSSPLQANLNVPTCPSSVRGPVMTVMASSGDTNTLEIDCSSTSTSYGNDLQAFRLGFATLTALYPTASP
jgi:5'-nucleotidase